MLVATDAYFEKLLRNLNGIIDALGPPRKNGQRRQHELGRDLFWSDLLAIWCKIGGKATGRRQCGGLPYRRIGPGLPRGAAGDRTRSLIARFGHPMAEASITKIRVAVQTLRVFPCAFVERGTGNFCI